MWFVLLISWANGGLARAGVDGAVASGRGSMTERSALISRIETAALLLECVARMIMDGEMSNDALARTLIARYAAQDAIGDATRAAVEMLGGMAFVRSPDVAYLAAVMHGLSFHPPSRSSVAEPLVDYFGGRALRLA
jgi:hypothetical protein